MKSDSRALPSGWRHARFDEALTRVERKVTVDDNGTYNCVGLRLYGLGAFIREQRLGIDIRRKQQWVVRKGDVIYNKLFAWRGAFAVASDLADGHIVSDKFPTYRADLSVVDPRYLAWYFRTRAPGDQAFLLSKGAAAISKLTLNPPQFWELTVPLPSLPEQRRIVAKLDTLAKKLEEARRSRIAGFRGGETAMVGVLGRVFGALRTEGACEPLESLRDPRRAISYGVLQRGADEPDGVPLVRIGDFHGATVAVGSLVRITPELDMAYPRSRLSGGEVLIAIRGTVGRVCLVPDHLAGANVSREVAVLAPRTGMYAPYLRYAITEPVSQGFLLSQVRGVGQSGINLSHLRKLRVPVPGESEQRRIAAHLDALQGRVDQLKQLQAKTAADLDALLPSLLDKAFRGEL